MHRHARRPLHHLLISTASAGSSFLHCLRCGHPQHQPFCLLRGFASSARLKKASTSTPNARATKPEEHRENEQPPSAASPPAATIRSSARRSASASAAAAASADSAAVGMEYQKKSQREHILLRPEPYVGSLQEDSRDLWTVEAGTGRMQLRTVTYIPALLHLYDEILVNAADNVHRNTASARMSRIDIDIASASSSSPRISIRNDGACIPVVLHPTEGCYVPELIFGHLLTSSNYDDSQQRFTGGRHGFGAKLTNILSSSFSLQLADCQRRLHYAQTWTDNMTQRGEPEIRTWTPAETQQRGSSFTSVSFTPDLRRFGQQRLTDDVVLLMERRAYDIAACVSEKGVKVRLNGRELPVASFADYVALFPLPADAPPLSFSAPHWHVTVAPLLSSSSSSQSRDISFVNSISTSRGGSHCQFIADKLSRVIIDHLLKHEKQLSGSVSPQLVRQSFSLFINCEVANPAFDSQTKETLITPVRDLPPVTLPPAFVRSLLSSPLLSALVEQLETRQTVELKRRTRQSRHRQLLIPKLDDAILAGSSRSSECTLILTEGDSAKALVLAGMSELGRDRWGVFPLRGKMLNVRDLSGNAMMRNEEIQHVARIIGLEYGKVYSTPASLSSLRYGSVMLMTDQDADGSHIKGLFINLLHSFWPSLLQHPSFLQTFSTAIVKARRGRQQLSFDSLLEYRRWRTALGEDGSRRWSIKYYKGLGTNSAEEGREYFRSLEKHRIGFLYTGQHDDSSIEMAFSKAAADKRKTWLQSYDPELTPAYVTPAPAAAAASAAASSLPVKLLPFAEFINKELILFSHADNVRSIPSVLDGLKPVQRKILFAAFKRGLTGEIKVAQLAGYVSEQTGYHHGEASLSAAIVGMAQAYTGSNNLPLLYGSGQFGTRHMGGKDAASSRYIFTRLESTARLLFDARDDGLLQHRDEDGLQVEPESFVPIIPFALVNGAEGIGTGFSTSIPAYHPLHIIRILRRRLTAGSTAEQGREEELTPWLRDHTGVVRPGGSAGVWLSEGVVRKVDAQRLEITELPWGRWTADYKDWLMSLLTADASGPFALKRVTEYHTNERVHFRIELSRDNMAVVEEMGLVKAFKLQSSISTLNMHLFDASGHIARYASPLAIIDAYFPVRLALYHSRRTALLDSLTALLRRLHNRSRFISSLISSAIVLHSRRRRDIEQELQQAGYDRLQEEGGADGGGFGYLLDQKLSALTEEEMLRLEKEKQRVEREVAELRGKTAERLWLDDLDRLELSLQRLLSREDEKAAKARRATATPAAEDEQPEDAEDESATAQAADAGVMKEVKRRVMTASSRQ